MRMLAGFALVGAALGAIVAVVAHLMSHTLPSHFTIGVNQIGNTVSLGSTPPSVHPSWWPSLLIAIVVGLLIGVVVGFTADRVGVRIVRPDAPAS